MTDVTQAIGWVAALAVGLIACVALKRWGVPSTHVRDLLHVGAGIWVLGWRGWNDWKAPAAIAWGAVGLTAVVPVMARRLSPAALFRDSVSGGSEGWAGLVLYTFSFALLTTVGLRGDRFSAGAALWSLCLGDGVGGAVGHRFGRHFFVVPGAKRKSWEGSATVAFASAVAVLLAAAWFNEPVRLGQAALVGGAAALVEAIAPRSTDNLLVPLAVWAVSIAIR
jgi:dolichol kinase